MGDDTEKSKFGHLRDVSMPPEEKRDDVPVTKQAEANVRRRFGVVSGGETRSGSNANRLADMLAEINEIYDPYRYKDVNAYKLLRGLHFVANMGNDAPEDLDDYVLAYLRELHVGSLNAQIFEALRTYSSLDMVEAALTAFDVHQETGEQDEKTIATFITKEYPTRLWIDDRLRAQTEAAIEIARQVVEEISDGVGIDPEDWWMEVTSSFETQGFGGLDYRAPLSLDERLKYDNTIEELVEAAWREWRESGPPMQQGA